MILNLPKEKELERKEEELRERVLKLPEDRRKAYYEELEEETRDPDTYAALNYAFLLGFHHIYARNIKFFLIEFLALVLFITLLVNQNESISNVGLAGIFIVATYQLIQLFLSQRIVRNLNYISAIKIYSKHSK